jgi:hypothetical protein
MAGEARREAVCSPLRIPANSLKALMERDYHESTILTRFTVAELPVMR